MQRSALSWFAGLSLLVLTAAPALPVGLEEITASRVELDAESLLHDLGRGLAEALVEPGIRSWLYEAMEASPYVEKRVALKRILAGDPELRAELLSRAGIDSAWEAVARSLPELELYFPIEDQRWGWTGEPGARVAVPIDESDRYWLYEANAEPRVFDPRDGMPPELTLRLGRSEIDYDDSESALEGGIRTGSYLAAYAASSTAELRHKSAEGVLTSQHSYLTYLGISEDHDPFQGSMEIEIFGSINGSYNDCTRLTGINPYVDYFLPNHVYRIAKAVPTQFDQIFVDVWEDDDTGCVRLGSDDPVGQVSLYSTQYNQNQPTTNPGHAFVAVSQGSCSLCGDGICEGGCGENYNNCPSDCPTWCGDSICGGTESASNCCADCAFCGNNRCDSNCGETTSSCPSDCPPCGDGFCDVAGGEHRFNCPADCSCTVGASCSTNQDCGDGNCSGGQCSCEE